MKGIKLFIYFYLDNQFCADGTLQKDFKRMNNILAVSFQDPSHDGGESRLELAQELLTFSQLFSIFL